MKSVISENIIESDAEDLDKVEPTFLLDNDSIKESIYSEETKLEA